MSSVRVTGRDGGIQGGAGRAGAARSRGKAKKREGAPAREHTEPLVRPESCRIDECQGLEMTRDFGERSLSIPRPKALSWKGALTWFLIGTGIDAALAARSGLAVRPENYGGHLADWMFLTALVFAVAGVLLGGTVVVPWRRRDLDAANIGRWRPWSAGFLAAAGLAGVSLVLSHFFG